MGGPQLAAGAGWAYARGMLIVIAALMALILLVLVDIARTLAQANRIAIKASDMNFEALGRVDGELDQLNDLVRPYVRRNDL